MKVGQKVVVTTRWKSNLYNKDYQDSTYVGVVAKKERFDPPDTFRINDDTPMRSRLITHSKVIEIILDGKRYDPKALFERKDNTRKDKVIAGSNDKFYSVTTVGGKAVSCDCAGFRFHKNCRHLAAAV